ncbi:DUF7127 family protein [Haloarchaeobius sp. HRN-SO-5]|uniref:DUF7127 family protein n=1 Tax=Haloarchaeobius sp. HRN-SO-5 TaxID=3446118 RepID=UPI003EBF70BB
MNVQDFADGERFVREYAYEDGRYVVAADLGRESSGAYVDVVGDTVIVGFEGSEEQYELDVPGVSQAFIKNGVVTIEVEADA